MKINAINDLEKLSLYCHFGGLFSVFVGIVVSLMDLINGDFKHIQTGIYIFATGYAIFKIGAKISAVLAEEKEN